jgi:hypothetical protein
LIGVEDGTYQTEGVTDAKGGFSTQVPPGRYVVDLVPTVDATYSAWWKTVDVANGLDLGVVDVAPTSTMAIRVVDPEGIPIAGAQFRVEEGGAGFRSWVAVTDETGEVTTTTTAARCDVVVTPPGARSDLAQTRIVVEEGSLPTTVSLGPGVRAMGAVRDALGAPAAYAAVRVVDAAGRSYALGLTDPDGRFSLRFVPPAADAAVGEDPATLDTATAAPIDTGGPGLTR